MTITITPVDHGAICHGSRWTVQDIDVLAERVARVALGQYRHVAQILDGLDPTPRTADLDHAAAAKHNLRVAANGDTWQRDGWLFQVISWITANQQRIPGAILKPPHIFHAHKGFDGIQLDIDADGRTITAVVIFEDKATTEPRDTVRDDVWVSIAVLETGQRVSELAHEATGLLEAHQRTFPDLNVDEAIDRVIWQQARRYRVSITTGPTHAADTDRQRLFAGYDDHVAGDVARRRAETMHFDDLRGWMNDFAVRVSSKIDGAVNV